MTFEGGTVTLLITDLVGSTAQLERLGDERAETLRRLHLRMLRRAIQLCGGREAKNLGDGLMVTFGSAVDATACAIAIQQAADRHNRREGARLDIRIGLHAGEPIRDEGDYFGKPVVVAKRLCDAAGAGQIVASEVVRTLVGTRGGYLFTDLGPLGLKGLAEPLVAYGVVWNTSSAPGVPLPSKLAAAERTDFVGRTEQLAHLHGALQRALAGERQLALVTGEAGIGKTRLLAEFARAAHADGAVVLLGHSFEETLIAYQPFREALQHFVRTAPEPDLRAGLGRYGGELVRLVPEMRDRVPDLPAPASGDPEGQRYRLFGAVAALLASGSAVTPVVLILEDLHWADAPTLSLFRYLVRDREEAPLLILGTYRDVELAHTPPLVETLADLRRDRVLDRLSLSGLPESDVGALVEAHAGRTVPAAFTRAVYAQTEGNPFFIGEVLRHLADNGVLGEVDGLTATALADRFAVPDGVKDVIAWRLSRLTEGCRRALGVAATIGEEFELTLLERVSGMEIDRLLDALEEAMASAIVAEVPRTVGVYSFVHTLIRETLYHELTTARRVRLHAQIGRALEVIANGDLEPRLAALAHHFFVAAGAGAASSAPGGADDVLAKAVDYAVRAGERASRLLAHEDAASHYRRALAGLDQQGASAGPPSDAVRRRAELLLRLGKELWNVGEIVAARETFIEAAAAGRRLGAAEIVARAALGIGTRVARFQIHTLDSILVALLEEALVSLEEGALRARVLACLTEVMALSGAGDRKVALAHAAVAMARRYGDPAALADVLLRARYALWTPENVEERLRICEEIIGFDGASGGGDLALNAREWLVIDLIETGDVRRADEELERFARCAEEVRQPSYLARALLLRALRLTMKGAFDEAQRLADNGVALTQVAPDAVVTQAFGAQSIVRQWERGRLAEMESLVADAVSRYDRTPAWRTALTWFYSQLDRRDDARREFDRLAADSFACLPHDMYWMLAMSHLADACAFLGDADRAALLYDLLAPHEHRYVTLTSAVFMGSASRPLAVLAATLGRWEEARRHFETALAMNARVEAAPCLARTQVQFATMLCDRGERARAEELLAAADATAQTLGLTDLAARIAAARGADRDAPSTLRA